MSWEYFSLFAIVSICFWSFGAYAAWGEKKPVFVHGFTIVGLAVFFIFILGNGGFSLERSSYAGTMGETRLWYSVLPSHWVGIIYI